MRESKSDSWICLAVIVVFIYCFFFMSSTVYYKEGEFDGTIHHSWEVKGIEYPTLIFIAPLIFLMFFCFIVFKEELRPITVWTVMFDVLIAWKILREYIKLQFK
jgi:hypothetical protein